MKGLHVSQTLIIPTPAILAKLDRLEAAVKCKVYERTWEIRTAIIALIARKHHLQIGKPGVAKTYLVEQLIGRIAGLDAHKNYYHTLMTKFTTPPDLTGPVSLKGLEQDIYRYNTTGMLPEAYVAFLDEIFKANSAVLNTLLTMMNEGVFFNAGVPVDVPLGTIFGGSNEMPTGSELTALKDRITFIMEVGEMREPANLMQMCRDMAVPKRLRLAVEPVITWDEIMIAQAEADEIVVSEAVVEKIPELRGALKKEGIELSPRHWGDCVPVIKATAYRAGHPIADVDDMRLLRFVLLSQLADAPVVRRIILDLCNPLDAEASELLDLIENLALEASKIRANTSTDAEAQRVAFELRAKLQRTEDRLNQLAEEAKKSPRQTEVVTDALTRVTEVTDALLFDLFGVKP